MPTKTADTLQYKAKSRVSTFDQYKWRALIGVTFCYLFYYTGRQTLGFAIPGIQHDYGLSKYEIGWISARCCGAMQPASSSMATWATSWAASE